MTDDLLALLMNTTVDPVVAGRALGISRSSTYRAVRNGSLPSVKVGALYRVPTEPLLEKLGLNTPEAQAAALQRLRRGASEPQAA